MSEEGSEAEAEVDFSEEISLIDQRCEMEERRRLVEEQDLEYQESLAMDQRKREMRECERLDAVRQEQAATDRKRKASNLLSSFDLEHVVVMDSDEEEEQGEQAPFQSEEEKKEFVRLMRIRYFDMQREQSQRCE